MRSYRDAAGHWRKAGSAIGLSVLMLAALAGCGQGRGTAAAGESENPAAAAVPVETVEAERRPIAASYVGTAPLEARAESQVVARTSGVALQVLVEEGDIVRAGQTLVRIDPDRARLNLAQIEAQMRKLESNFNRSAQLAAQQLVSAGEHDQLRYELENLRAAYRLAQLELSYTDVEAPISGVIASRSIKTGNFVQINTPILRIVDNANLEATLNVPERELATLKAGLPVRLQVDALPGQVFEGTVARVAPVIDAGSGTFRVICAFSADALQPGMFGRVRIDYDQRADALTIPRLALLDDEGDPAVYVIRDGVAARTPVELGYVDGSRVEVRAGLEAGDAVVTAGKVALRDGSTVQVIGAQVAQAPATDDGDAQ
ncbi:efflux RND transporter periplasmic adaptor subunit [Luteimonas abyssi]|uniref:efflux RND transporter periplasmic adaptor subunit n=1 Tax=Luteimonas abyssi TaxID=1247514 RepID=UPI000737AFCF